MERVLLCRYGELFLKSGNRKRFERTLVDNLRAALAGIDGACVEARHGRILVRLRGGGERDRVGAGELRSPEPVAGGHGDPSRVPTWIDEAAARVGRVFGLVSLSVAQVVPADIDAIAAAAEGQARDAVARARPASFRIDAHRADKRFPLPSMEIARVVGARVAAGTGLPVDLEHPGLRIGVEVGLGGTYVHAGKQEAPGGLPVGVSGRALLLLSGGIDSPVAGWLAAKRGLSLDAVYFHSPPFVGEKSRDKVLALGRLLARWQALRSITVVEFTQTQQQLRQAGPAELAVVLYRRAMMRVADAIADQLGASALVTGENLGQVASQTVENMTVIQAAARRVVLRPLITNDKVETIALARRIGTYETSILPYEDCCSLFVPPHPATRARAADAERAEAKLDMQAEIARVVAAAEQIAVA